MNREKCRVFEVVRGSTHDGPGLRTTVFFKGCPLNCLWCQNPEGISREIGIAWEADRCIGCLECVQNCSAGAICEGQSGIKRDLSLCTLCGAYVRDCPSKAMEFTARKWSMDGLLREVLKDRDYYTSFKGGVTVSGGEPLLQYKFVGKFFRLLHLQGVHTALDTCGLASGQALDAVIPHTDHILFDLKLIDPRLHKKYTGKPNNVILKNLISTGEAIRQSTHKKNPGNRIKLWIRTPLIPGANADTKNIVEIGRFIHENLSDVTERWELCSFNNSCSGKYRRLGLTWPFESTPLMSRDTAEDLQKSALSTGFPKKKLFLSGLVSQRNDKK